MALSSSATDSNKPLRGVIFDMDGTLTIPNLDFAEMYRRCGVDKDDDILAAIARMETEDAAKASAIVEEMEEEGRRTLQLMPGTVSVLQWLAFYNIPTALVTRNTFKSTLRLQELLQEADPNLPQFSPVVARDTEPIQPPKPDTAALKYITTEWNVELSEQFVMVGDSPSNDIRFGRDAGISTALLWQSKVELKDQGGAHILVSRLSQLPRHFLKTYSLTPKPLPENTAAPKPTSEAGKAACAGDLETLRSMSLEELVAKDEFCNTPLIWASEAGQEKAVECLVDAITINAENPALDDHINTRGYLESTAVSRAARHGHTQVLDLLARHPINANIPNIKLQYPLHVAAFRQHSSIVQRLLEAGADPYAVDQKGRTPLEDTSCEEVRAVLQSAMTEET